MERDVMKDGELLRAAWDGDVGRVRELLSSGAATGDFNDTNDTPLHLAIENLRLEVVRVLLDAGADVNLRTADGDMTPLAHAVDIVCDAALQAERAPDNELIRLLIQYGANVNAPTNDGMTPLGLLRLGYGNNKEAEAILLAAEAADTDYIK